ncbi:9001_t:CDS:1 [Funneliformis geosporum]|uniref:12753_t:CDS:1 n=1 Tax=Funneliformis geosporum TaxID=1117311 RepID=A0A9W4WTM8_9GLOM|nr:12753_t:CDS:1 [Funneliformis geosporum]CAI2180079.1 9001_t:CDS:1 [Funneliformis geosporum]
MQNNNSSPIFVYSHFCQNPEPILASLLSQTPPPYHLTVPLDDLINSRRRPNGTIPSPKNAFMLFRKDLNAKLKQNTPGLTFGKLSGIASQSWKHQPQSVLQFFEVMSMVATQRHRILKTSPIPPTKPSNPPPQPKSPLKPSTPSTPPTPVKPAIISTSLTPLTPPIPLTPLMPLRPPPSSIIILNSSEDNLDWIRYNYIRRILGF